ncbi:hypothetical protein TWF718_006417 [Orbilia javanica]|uniref:F-box domain-containing protein n=1 Tax=Orbilia javanica TaxID=47235 RepID=A0AAN8N4Y9_9PEZI
MPPPTANLSSLPPTILDQIFLYLPPKALLTKYRLVCKSWKSTISTSAVTKYYSTTGTYQPTNERQIRWYRYRYGFNPLFLPILDTFWKRLVPLWVRYQEQQVMGESEEEEDERRRQCEVNIAFVREIGVLYRRYLHIFSTIPMFHPVYRETNQRIMTEGWGAVQQREKILRDQENQEYDAGSSQTTAVEEMQSLERLNLGEEEQGDEKFYIPFAYKYQPPGVKYKNSEAFLIYLCRFIFTHIPAYRSNRPVDPKTISTRLYVKVKLAGADQESDTPAEGRTLQMMSYGDEGSDSIVVKFDP